MPGKKRATPAVNLDGLALEHGIIEAASLRLLHAARRRIVGFNPESVLRLAATIMDLDGDENSEIGALAEAIQYTAFRVDPSDAESAIHARTIEQTMATLTGPLLARGRAILDKSGDCL